MLYILETNTTSQYNITFQSTVYIRNGQNGLPVVSRAETVVCTGTARAMAPTLVGIPVLGLTWNRLCVLSRNVQVFLYTCTRGQCQPHNVTKLKYGQIPKVEPKRTWKEWEIVLLVYLLDSIVKRFIPVYNLYIKRTGCNVFIVLLFLSCCYWIYLLQLSTCTCITKNVRRFVVKFNIPICSLRQIYQ